MKNKIGKIFTIILIFIAFTTSLNATAAPDIILGLELDYDYFGVSGTADNEVIIDNGTFWTLTTFIIYDSTPLTPFITLVNKTALQNTYNYTQIDNGEMGEIKAQGYNFWIDTDGLSVGENITLMDQQFKLMEQIILVVPAGTFTVFNATWSNTAIRQHSYFDVDTGFLIKSYSPLDGKGLELESSNSPTISEFSAILFPILLIAIPITIKYSKTLKDES